MDHTDFLQRAASAAGSPTLYWLGKGGWLQAETAQPAARAQPGRPIDVARELEALQRQRPRVHAAYMDALARTGLTLAGLPTLACDCSGFVCWALGVARDGAVLAGGWIGTDAIVADALGARLLFEPAAQAAPGVLIVHPKPRAAGADGPPGHIGIVTAVASDDGRPRASRVLHCAPENFLLPAAAGRVRSAIVETGPAHFDADPRSMLVNWRGFGR